MTENEKVLYACLKSYWKMARDRNRQFSETDEKLWLGYSVDSLLKYSKLSWKDIYSALKGLKADDRIDFKLRVYDNSTGPLYLVLFSNNW